jgi:hypothetical protein
MTLIVNDKILYTFIIMTFLFDDERNELLLVKAN